MTCQASSAHKVLALPGNLPLHALLHQWAVFMTSPLHKSLIACTNAGAFVLMQEAGDVQPVITWGRAWLEDNAMDNRAKDVALVAALAHCDLAGAPCPGNNP
jgi:hypothetical protein